MKSVFDFKIIVNKSKEIGNKVPPKPTSQTVEALIESFLSLNTLDILPQKELNNAVKSFVDLDDKDAIKEFVKKSLSQSRGSINKKEIKLREEQYLNVNILKSRERENLDESDDVVMVENSDSESDEIVEIVKSKRKAKKPTRSIENVFSKKV